jgi:uncharacterized membrane protein HdeD (DUF308 family)
MALPEMNDIDQDTDRPPIEEPINSEKELTVGRRRSRQLDRQAAWAAHNWGWLLGFGVVALILGIVVAGHAFGSLHALIWLSGLFLLFIGVAELLITGKGDDRRTHLLAALAAIVGGIVLLVWPGETARIAAVVAGVTVLVWGLVRAAAALREAHSTRGHDLVVGGALIALGIVMIVWPEGTITLVGLLIGVTAIVWGLVTIASAFHLRAVGRRWKRLHERARPAA